MFFLKSVFLQTLRRISDDDKSGSSGARRCLYGRTNQRKPVTNKYTKRNRSVFKRSGVKREKLTDGTPIIVLTDRQTMARPSEFRISGRKKNQKKSSSVTIKILTRAKTTVGVLRADGKKPALFLCFDWFGFRGKTRAADRCLAEDRTE